MKFNRLAIFSILALWLYQSAFSACNMETSWMVEMGTWSWSIYDINNLEIASGLWAGWDIAWDFNNTIAWYTFSLSWYALQSQGNNLDPTTWSLVAVDGRFDSFSGSCDTTIGEYGEVVITPDDYIMLNILEIGVLIVAGLFLGLLFILKQI